MNAVFTHNKSDVASDSCYLIGNRIISDDYGKKLVFTRLQGSQIALSSLLMKPSVPASHLINLVRMRNYLLLTLFIKHFLYSETTNCVVRKPKEMRPKAIKFLDQFIAQRVHQIREYLDVLFSNMLPPEIVDAEIPQETSLLKDARYRKTVTTNHISMKTDSEINKIIIIIIIILLLLSCR